MGFGIYGLMDDVFALLPLEDLKTLFHTKMETREYIRTIVTTIYSPVFVVSIHYVYINCVACCLCYAHTSKYVNSCDECITSSHRICCTLCEPCQNTMNCLRNYEKWVLMWSISSNTFGYYLACPTFSKKKEIKACTLKSDFGTLKYNALFQESKI